MSSAFGSFLLTLEDEECFAVMRNYLGALKTPFNKHDLIRRLERFLTRKETLRRIRSYLDEADRELLLGIHRFGEPREEELLYFFSDSRGYFDLHSSLLNLQDRLLVLSDRDSRRLSINPLLLEFLEPELEKSRLIPSVPSSPSRDGSPSLVPSLPGALYAFLRGYPGPCKSDGTLKTRPREGLAETIPLLVQLEQQRAPLPPRLAVLLRVARNLGLLEGEQELTLIGDGLRLLAERSPGEQLLIIAAAAGGISEAGALRAAREATRDLLEQLQPQRAYEANRLERYLGMLIAGRGGSREEGGRLLRGLKATGVLQDDQEGYLTPRPPGGIETAARQAPSPALVSPNFEISLPSEAPLRVHLEVAGVARLLRFDRYCRYEITRAAFLHGCHDRQSAEARIERVRAVAQKLPQNVAATLTAWVGEYGAFRLISGIVLTTEAAQATLIDHAPVLQPYIRARLAEGVFLLDHREQEWRAALGQLGFEQLPPVEGGGRSHRPGRFPFEEDNPSERELPWTPRLDEAGGERREEGGSALRRDEQPEPEMEALEPGDLAEQLAGKIDALSAGDEIKQELHRRLELKLLLYGEQLENDAARRAASEARGLDYLGKIRIIEAALSASPDLLEVLTRRPGEEPARLLLRPSSLEKGKDDVILHGTSIPGNRPVKLQVRKIALLRKLTGTLIRTL